MTDHQGIAVVRRWWTEVWGEGRLELIPELTTEPFIRHSQSETVTRTHAELTSDMQTYRRALSGCEPTFESQLTGGDRVFSRIRTSGVNLETGDSVVVHWMQEHRIEDGRLAETWVLYTFRGGWDGDGVTRHGYPNTPVG